MQIQAKAMGDYMTNCYIVTVEGKDLIIDPGVGATEWVMEQARNPVAILNTHGHFDHVWSNAELKERLGVKIYVNEKDAPLLQTDPFGLGTPPSEPDVLVEGTQTLQIEGVEVTFHEFAGHTPGCSVIEIGDVWFSGDFLFKQSIGRYDFPLSDAQQMKQSLQRVMQVEKNFTVYPGHGEATTLEAEKRVIPFFISQI